jgi:hypothetical protein
MTSRWLFSVACATLAVSPSARAQSPAVTGTIVHGRVRDSLLGIPVQRGVAFLGNNQATVLERDGSFRFSPIEPGTSGLTVSCFRGGQIFDPRVLVRRSLTVHPDTGVYLDLYTDSRVCDPRPLVEIAGTFTGHYSLGFEQSRFTPCGGGPSSWVVLSDRSQRARFPPDTTAADGYAEYFVRWRGRQLGPGQYGHMGISEYELLVTEVIEARAPRARDCEP